MAQEPPPEAQWFIMVINHLFLWCAHQVLHCTPENDYKIENSLSGTYIIPDACWWLTFFMKQYSTDFIFPILYLFLTETKGRNAI